MFDFLGGWSFLVGFFVGYKTTKWAKTTTQSHGFFRVKSMIVDKQNPCRWRYLVLLPQCLVRLAYGKENRIWGQYLVNREISDKHVLKHSRSMSYTTKSKKIMSKLGFFPFRIFFFKNNKAGWFIAQRITLNNHRPFLTSLCNLAKLEEAELCFQWSSEELLSSPLKWATFQNPCNLDPYHGWVYSHITWAVFCPPYKQPVRVNWSLLKYAWLLSY